MPSESIHSDQSKLGELLVSLLDYTRLLLEDPSAVELIALRLAAIRVELERQNLEWEMVKEYIVNSFATFSIEIHF